ncbi:hypothetical protein wCauBTS_12790 [Wolbachia pipientis]|uniref:hypothetical protein n=1 Tax=Wolbachia pipientis TaxID=955 RepID=UPI0038B53CB6
MTLWWKKILAVESDPRLLIDIDKQANLKKMLVLSLREAINKPDVSIVTNLYEHFTQKSTRNRREYPDSQFSIIREIYKNAFILVSNDIAKLNEKNLNQIISRKVGQIETILAIVSLIDNKRLIKKMLNLVEKNIKNNPEGQQVLLKSLVNILTYSIKNERLQTINYIYTGQFSKKNFCSVIQEIYIKAFADSKVVEELENKIEKQEKSAKYEWWMELKKYLDFNQKLNDLQELKEIVNKFIEASDYHNKLCQDENYPALSYYNTEIDLERLEQITRKFINDSGHISEKEVLKQKKLQIPLPGEKQLVENLRKLEKRISTFIQFVYEKTAHDEQYPGFVQSPKKKDFMILAQIIHELFLEKDDFESVDKEELPSPYLEKVKEKSYIRGVLSYLTCFVA